MRGHTIEETRASIMRQSRQNLCTGCTEWTGYTNSKGYGVIRANRKMHGVHRVVWEWKRGAIPDGLHVLHACDNPSCVEIEHLFLGTNRDNIDDKVAKDRSGKKLDISSVRQIKEKIRSGIPVGEIAHEFGVHQCGISRIKSGERWAHV